MVVDESDESPSDISPLQAWPSSRGELALRLLASGDDLIVENELMGRFQIDGKRARITVPSAAGVPSALREAFLWSTPFAVAGTDPEHLVVHAASVAVEDQGILLVGDTRAGKTTLAGAFHNAGYRLLSDDGARCSVKQRSVFPGPALLRLRTDMAERFDRSDLELVHQTPDKTHFAVAESRRGDGRGVPISAVVFLNWGENHTELLSTEAAIARLWRLTFYLPETDGIASAFTSLSELLRTLPVYDVFRPQSLDDVSALVERLVDTCLA